MPYVIVGILIVAVIAVFFVLKSKKSAGRSGGKSQSQIIREAKRKLDRNPDDVEGLSELGDIYFQNKLWDKALPIYERLYKLAAKDPKVDSFQSILRHGVCFMNLDNLPEAIKSLSLAYQMNSRDFEVNYYMGLAMFKDKNYDKAVPCLKKALAVNPEAEGVYLILGQSYYYGNHYRDSLPCFKRALDEDPTNKEALFDMADAMNIGGHGDKSIKVFMHLRADPVYGPRSCLEAGVYHIKMDDYDAAIQDFEVGMKHTNIETDVLLDLQYRTAQCYFNKNDFATGLQLLNKIRLSNANYKDVNALISRYQELSQNTNLQIYLSAGASDFVALCRKFIETIYRGSQVKIMDIQVQPAYTDILAEVDTVKITDIELFRFFRTSGSSGELYVRDLHGHMHDVKADRGFCITAGVFSEDAQKYIEGRPLDLIEKSRLVKVLKSITL
ncbi:MAG: tetratricopeptide repeat protein [Treponema sp.]|nr:tetratricopeptide repeat protein [Treponema sp.]